MKQAEEIKEKYATEIENLKDENNRLKELRDHYLSRKKARNIKNDLSQTGFSFNSNVSSGDENYLRTTLDKEKHQTNTKKKMLFTLQDKLKDV